MLDMQNGEENCKWIILNTKGVGPGKRYGHSLCYYKPYIILFGGNAGNRLTNQTWILNISDLNNLQWEPLTFTSDTPSPRTYHANALCKYGVATGMIIVYGGRGEDNNALYDTWGLRRHRNNTWDWLRAPYTQNYQPIKRFQVKFI
jgi:protein phosphatase